MKATILTLLFLAACSAQMRNNTTQDLKCDNENNWGRKAHTCDMREQTIAYAGQLTVDGRENGGVSVKGWDRSDVLVRMKVEASADTDSEAKAIASQIRANVSAGRISADGPQQGSGRNWSVSFEVFTPHRSNLELTAMNGGIHLADLSGTIHFNTKNGGVHIARLAGDVKGETVNGGVHIELAGNRWDGQGLDVKSTNGGVHMSVPANYSAQLETSTENGGIHSDFASPTEATARQRDHHIKSNLGSGGALVRVVTTNGGVKIARI